MGTFERFAKKYFEESLKDLERAKRAFKAEDYPQAVFYAQQSVEKGVKAMLEFRKHVVYNHGPGLIGIFAEVFEDEWQQEFNHIIESLEYLTEYYTRARYPFLLRGEVLSPDEIVTKEVADRGIQLAEKAVGVVRDYLAGRGVISS
ncbi:MAG: HEPN domain-containing protein [Nitrososphaerota archaeon]